MSDKLDDLRKKMNEAKIKQEVRWLVEKLSQTLWEELERINPSDEDRDKAVEIFSKVSKGHDFKEDESDTIWVQAKAGALIVGDYVRVKKDAFSHQPATAHNGREGRIVALRYGDIYVKYNDFAPTTGMNSVRHTAESLEKRVQ